jgi:hypothetical protein
LLLPDHDAALVVYFPASCSSASSVARRLDELGYADVAVYEGGKEDRVEHRLPLAEKAARTVGSRSG